jgi:hypothetical protein
MSEPGESLDPVRMLNVASWRKLRASRGRVQRGLESQNLRPPHMRAQRTRALASLGTLTSFARSSLTCCPLGGDDKCDSRATKPRGLVKPSAQVKRRPRFRDPKPLKRRHSHGRWTFSWCRTSGIRGGDRWDPPDSRTARWPIKLAVRRGTPRDSSGATHRRPSL